MPLRRRPQSSRFASRPHPRWTLARTWEDRRPASSAAGKRVSWITGQRGARACRREAGLGDGGGREESDPHRPRLQARDVLTMMSSVGGAGRRTATARSLIRPRDLMVASRYPTRFRAPKFPRSFERWCACGTCAPQQPGPNCWNALTAQRADRRWGYHARSGAHSVRRREPTLASSGPTMRTTSPSSRRTGSSWWRTGWGGHASGDVASKMSTEGDRRVLSAQPPTPNATWPYRYDPTRSFAENRMIRVDSGWPNERIHYASQRNRFAARHGDDDRRLPPQRARRVRRPRRRLAVLPGSATERLVSLTRGPLTARGLEGRAPRPHGGRDPRLPPTRT